MSRSGRMAHSWRPATTCCVVLRVILYSLLGVVCFECLLVVVSDGWTAKRMKLCICNICIFLTLPLLNQQGNNLINDITKEQL